MNKTELKRKKNKILFLKVLISISAVCIVLMLVLIIQSLRLNKAGNGNGGLEAVQNDTANAESPNSKLNGSYFYEEDTIYDFDGEKFGCLHLLIDEEEFKYGYQYTVENDRLYIDFNSEELHDAVYTFSISGDKLTLTGEEGTAGGVYELTRKDVTKE
ncbi:MAG: DUF5640 domain-containing protein [Clostridium sp.]|nr:DUF5640 domain-containing protein [Clostridium sp.]